MHQNTEDHLPPYRVRPRFNVEVDLSVAIIEDKLRAGLAVENANCKGRVRHGYATLVLPEVDQHYWSPQLSLTLEAMDNGSLIRGLYGPRPAVWTMFVFFYSLIGIAILFILIFGTSRMSVNESGSILWFIPVLILIFLSLYLVAYFGQKVGHDQMEILHRFLEDSLGVEIDAHED